MVTSLIVGKGLRERIQPFHYADFRSPTATFGSTIDHVLDDLAGGSTNASMTLIATLLVGRKYGTGDMCIYSERKEVGKKTPFLRVRNPVTKRVSSISYRTALYVGATGRLVNLQKKPTCGNKWCMNPKHQAEDPHTNLYPISPDVSPVRIWSKGRLRSISLELHIARIEQILNEEDQYNGSKKIQ